MHLRLITLSLCALAKAVLVTTPVEAAQPPAINAVEHVNAKDIAWAEQICQDFQGEEVCQNLATDTTLKNAREVIHCFSTNEEWSDYRTSIIQQGRITGFPMGYNCPGPEIMTNNLGAFIENLSYNLLPSSEVVSVFNGIAGAFASMHPQDEDSKRLEKKIVSGFSDHPFLGSFISYMKGQAGEVDTALKDEVSLKTHQIVWGMLELSKEYAERSATPPSHDVLIEASMVIKEPTIEMGRKDLLTHLMALDHTLGAFVEKEGPAQDLYLSLPNRHWEGALAYLGVSNFIKGEAAEAKVKTRKVAKKGDYTVDLIASTIHYLDLWIDSEIAKIQQECATWQEQGRNHLPRRCRPDST